MEQQSLPAQKLAELQQRGFTVLRKQLDGGQLQGLRQSASEALDAARESVARGERIPFQPGTRDFESASSLYRWGAAPLRLLDHPLVHTTARAVFGRYLLNDLTVFSVPPADAEAQVCTTSWHRDCPMTLPEGVSAHLWFLFALDEFHPNNGATWVVPRSHIHDVGRLGAPWQPLDPGDFPGAVQLLMDAGDLTILDARTIHSSGPNRSAQARRLMNLGLVHPAMRARVRVDHRALVGAELLALCSERVRGMFGEPAGEPSGAGACTDPTSAEEG